MEKNIADGVKPKKKVTKKDVARATNVNRVEVIDQRGRVYVNRNVQHCELSFQDNGRTLKIFILAPHETI